MSGRKKRIELIRKIQKPRGSQVIVYFTGDRQPFASQKLLLCWNRYTVIGFAFRQPQPRYVKSGLFHHTKSGVQR